MTFAIVNLLVTVCLKRNLEEDILCKEFKGVMAENYCLQELTGLLDYVPFYWSSGNLAEIDFVVQFTDKIVPIEVKAAENVKSKSLAVYRKKYKLALSIKTSRLNLNYKDGLLNCPLYLLWKLPEFIEKIFSS